MIRLDKVIFYTIEKAIKSYRQYAQKQIIKAGFDITIDQWLVMKCLMDEPDIHLQDLAKKVFKDNASITRIVEKLVQNKYLKRSEHNTDGRRSKLILTKKGEDTIIVVNKIVIQNRKHALEGINTDDVELTKSTLEKIITNCFK